MNLNRFRIILIFLSVLGITFIGFLVFRPYWSDCRNRIAFNSEKWKNWVETEANLTMRWDMSSDLIKKHQLEGLTKDEVIALLGPPDSNLRNGFHYYLGMTRSGINTGSLILKTKEGIVISYIVASG